MAKTEMIRARIEPSLKEDVSSIFKTLGLSTTEAITMFYKMVKLKNGIPFELKIPNSKTKKVLKETDKGINLKEWNNADEFFKQMM